MKKTPKAPLAATPLRRRAETRLRDRSAANHSANAVGKSPADIQRLHHALQVHLVELEMQNEELRKTRDEMEAGYEKYSELYDFAPVGYLTFDRKGAIREANLAAAGLLGISRGPLLKQPFGLFVVPADRPRFHAFLKQVFESKGRQECELRLLGKNKAVVQVRIRANYFALGEVCWVAVSDITQHKLAEAATAQLAGIVASSGVAIVGKDLNGIVTSWNAGAEKLFGYSAAEMVGTSIARLIPLDRPSEEQEIIRRIRKGESVVDFETVRVGKDGRRLDMSLTISPIRQAGGEIIGASKVGHDITARRQAEDKVRISEIRYRRLFEAAHDGVLLLDPGTRKITEANPFMTKLLGYSRDQLIGKELFEIGLLKDEVASQEMFRKLQRKHEVRYEDLPLESQGGRHQEVEVVANLYQENGHAVIQCNIRDITARKQVEDALGEARAQLGTYAERLEKMVGLRTAQLTAMNRRLVASVDSISQGREKYRVLLSESEFMQKKLRSLARQILTAQEDERRNISRELHDEVVQLLVGINVELAALGHAAGLGPRALKARIARTQRLVEKSVNAVHQFARELRPAVLDDLGLIPALQAYMKGVAARRKLHINLTASAEVEKLDAPARTVLYRVVQEALTNVARHAQASVVNVTISEISGAIRLEVQDNGKSFKVLQTLSAKTNQRLGLLGMRERVEIVGGTLHIDSSPGFGTTVRTEVPFPPKDPV